MRKMNSRDRRALLLGSIVLLPVLWIYGVSPYLNTLAESREQVRVQRDLLSRELALLTAVDEYPALYRTADSTFRALEPALFQDADPMMATFELSAYIGRQARMNEVLLQEAEPRAATVAGNGVRSLQVEIRAESDLEGLLRFLQSLESGSKLVRIDGLSITAGGTSGFGDQQVLTLAASIKGFSLTIAGSQ
jgi:hypothetical protein